MDADLNMLLSIKSFLMIWPLFDLVVMPFEFIQLDFLSYFYDIKNERPIIRLKHVNKDFYEGFGMQI